MDVCCHGRQRVRTALRGMRSKALCATGASLIKPSPFVLVVPDKRLVVEPVYLQFFRRSRRVCREFKHGRKCLVIKEPKFDVRGRLLRFLENLKLCECKT